MTEWTGAGGVSRRAVLATMVGGVAMSAGLARADMAAPSGGFLSLGTSSVGGSWFALGGAMANQIGKAYPQLRVTAEATGGSVDNLKLMKNAQLELALTTSAESYQARHGKAPFGAPITNFSAVMSGGSINWQLYTLKKTGITSIRDLKGKRVSLGAPGSIGNAIGKTVIEAHGLKMSTDWQPEYIGHGDGPDALRDGSVDAVLIVSTFPTSALIDLTSSEKGNVVFLNPDPKILDKLLEDYPYWAKIDIPGGIYEGHPDNIPGSFGIATLLVAANTQSIDTIYAVTKAIAENGGALGNAVAQGKAWKLDTALKGIDGVLPLHPGAKAYFQEKGLL